MSDGHKPDEEGEECPRYLSVCAERLFAITHLIH